MLKLQADVSKCKLHKLLTIPSIYSLNVLIVKLKISNITSPTQIYIHITQEIKFIWFYRRADFPKLAIDPMLLY